ncbi:hypothetical protein G7Y89_g3586 [Cudoniella acicularis]|uniref:Ubiquitin carrier protein n=1 Tax=Cudoniella acicularis TaxID=354080 RepID=A0A8H4RSA9_9HELO|nr:hypothetical protein G7Y89_g3586 [Cudoniella acicularis]
MSASLVGILARRGIELHNARKEHAGSNQFPIKPAVLVVTTVVFFAAFIWIQYIFGRVIPTLAMIESRPDLSSYEHLPTEDQDTDATVEKDQELESVKSKPITTSLQLTLKLLKSRGGRRGFRILLITQTLIGWTAAFFSALPYVPTGVGLVLAPVIWAQPLASWTHLIISERNPKPWYRYLALSMKTWRKLAVPTAVVALIENASILLPIYAAYAAGFGQKRPQEIAKLSTQERNIMIGKGAGIFSLAMALTIVLAIPASVVLTRVQASLLPESEETIVPFDRTFKGKVVPETVGGSGVIGMLDAWTTFDWSDRIRLVKTYVKVFLIYLALIGLFIVVIYLELVML